MSAKRVFKMKAFGRWAKKLLTDSQLCSAAREIERGEFEADLGGGICKKRIAVAGKGKSGATRVLVAKKHEGAIFFLVGRGKSEPGKDFPDKVVEAAKIGAKSLENASTKVLDEMCKEGQIEEICHGRKSEEQTDRQ